MHSVLRLCQKQVILCLQHYCRVKFPNKLFTLLYFNQRYYHCQSLIMATNRYCIDLAKRGTAGCKECKKKIDKGVVRIAKIIPNPFTESGGEMKQWFHTKCIFEKLSRARATTKKIESSEDLEGWDELADEHKSDVEQYISDFVTILPNKTAQKKTPQKKVKKQAEEPEEESSPPDDNKKPTKDDTLRQFRKICADLSSTPEYTKKTATLAKFFSKGSDGSGFKGDLFLWAKMLLPMVEKRVYNLQTKQLFKLFSEIFGCSKKDMEEHFEKEKGKDSSDIEGDVSGDVAVTISTFFEESDKCPPASKSTLYLQDVDKYLHRLSQVSREFDQSSLLTEVAKKCTENDLKMFIRFIKHDLRINAGPKPVLDAIHPTAYAAFQASRNLKEIIYRSMKQNSGTSSQDDLAIQSSLMTPVLPMLAMACKSYEDVHKRCPKGYYVEIKYDGERVQLHKRGNEFSYFSRSLKPVMPHKIAHLREYIPKAFPHGNNLMLDCEILLVDNDGKPLPFGTLGAHKKSEFKDASVCLFVFDCLQFNDENLMNKPLVERRRILKENMKSIKNHVMISEMKEVDDVNELRAMIQSVFKQGLEGVVCKAKDSIYEPGKRHWLKIKKDYVKDDTMIDAPDLVVLGAFFGTGKFGGQKSIFLMGCKNTKTGKWCTVTKVHNGLTDGDIKRLNKHPCMKEMIKISKESSKVPRWLNVHDSLVPDFVVKDPEESLVWEINGAEFTRTDIHTANGISIRFPRITRERNDKTWREATDLDLLEDYFKKSKQTSDLIGLQIAGDIEDDSRSNNSPGKSPLSDAEELPSRTKKMKKESSTTPQKNEKKRKVKNEREEATPIKKPKREANNDENSTTCSTTDSKNSLPDVFRGVKLHIPPSLEKFDILRRYFIAYDGKLLEEHNLKDASHVIITGNRKGDKFSTTAKKITVDWLWDCIKLQKILPTHLYHPKSESS